MELSVFFKSVIDTDDMPVVICDTDNIIIYMNPSAVENYAKRGGASLIGHSILACHNEESNSVIKMAVSWFKESTKNDKVFTLHKDKENKDIYIVALRDGDGEFIGYYEKHECRNPETSPRYDMD